MKKILFVINTLGCGGAEMAMLELIRNLNGKGCEISLFVLMNQGEMIHQVPDYVKVLNENITDCSVLNKEGKKHLKHYIRKTLFCKGSVFKNILYLVKNLVAMVRKGKILPDKLLWRVMSDGAPEIHETYDLAVAYLEGGSAYYVADHVKAARKVGFIHIDYEKAGYTRNLDKSCYENYHRIFTVSEEVKQHFIAVYPEYRGKTEVFHNMINQNRIRERAKLPGGFEDEFNGTRILTVGRLTAQKAYEIAIAAMKLLKDKGENVRWYVLGEGEERKVLEKQIEEYGLQKDFLLLGAKSNPYPYLAQADLYVHATRYEGKSIAIQEAQTLGCTILVSDCSGNREQVNDGVDGAMCKLTPEGICEGICKLLEDKEACRRYREAAAKKNLSEEQQIERFLSLL